MGQKDRLKCGALLCVARFFLLLYINSGNLTAISVMELIGYLTTHKLQDYMKMI